MSPTIVRFESSQQDPYPLQVQGESHYRADIEEITDHLDEDDGEGVDANDFTARLVLDDNNQYDPGNAVRVEIDGKLVGYLAKPIAKAYRQRLTQLGLSDVIGECAASIKGGFALSEGGWAEYGVRLDLDLETFKASSAAQPPRARQPFLKSFLALFFGPGKFRLLRIILFFFLVMFLCGCCISTWQIITGNG